MTGARDTGHPGDREGNTMNIRSHKPRFTVSNRTAFLAILALAASVLAGMPAKTGDPANETAAAREPQPAIEQPVADGENQPTPAKRALLLLLRRS